MYYIILINTCSNKVELANSCIWLIHIILYNYYLLIINVIHILLLVLLLLNIILYNYIINTN